MTTDLLAAATDRIRDLITRRSNPLTSLEATYLVCDSLSEEDAKELLKQLIWKQFLVVAKEPAPQVKVSKPEEEELPF